MSDITFVTTCKGRLAHLRQSLPRMVAQAGADVVVVDYACPDGAGDWVNANFPQVTVVRDEDRGRFEVARARNLGAAAATSEWLCFIDADILALPGLLDAVRPQLQPNYYLRPSPHRIDMMGTCVVRAADHARIGGYDAVLQSYGMEDRDYYARLRFIGVGTATFPGALLEAISHDNAERVVHYPIKQMGLSSGINQLYCTIKWDLMRLHGAPLDEPTRTHLYSQVAHAALGSSRTGKEVKLRVPVGTNRTRTDRVIDTTLVYRFIPSDGPKRRAEDPAERRLPGDD